MPGVSVTVFDEEVDANVTLLPFAVVPVKSWHWVDVTLEVELTLTVTVPLIPVMVASEGMSLVSNVRYR